jgi:hypothetical protein
VTALPRAWAPVKVELKRGLRTFGVAWLLFTLALLLLVLVTKAHGFGDVLRLLTIGVLVCAVYTLWPALTVAACRTAYRILGAGALVGAFLNVLGVLTCLTLFRNVLFSMLLGVFDGGGPCGAHASVLAGLCLAVSLLGSPESWGAMLELLLAVSGVTLLGCVPGVALWTALVARQVARLARRGVSR